MPEPRLVVFDGDDTLWRSEVLYDRAREAAAEVVGESGLDASRWSELQRRIDLQNVLTMGLSADRFPRSAVMAYEELARARGIKPSHSTIARVREAALSVFDAEAELVDGARDVVVALSRIARLVLLTKGDRVVQQKRIDDSGLSEHFDELLIVEQKTADTFRLIADSADIQPHRCWSIGNSLVSDVNPAIEAGWEAIWIDAHVWEHERREVVPAVERVVVLERLSNVSAFFGLRNPSSSHTS